ncbi:THAP domain-containing protein 2 isoform X3 [Diabrotica virgifera virgifera]|uniref:THAP-type domain-containing protein n=1 Tax=Diabrotica virgifera virgifera TaxID=50390 RepID=A0ABM5L089_DIAVI|nr:THAP domain-containing protein 2 isoform X3 [Diabrotica virgifera virgifera]
MVSCAKRSCNHRAGVDKKKTSGITFHRFPKDPEHRKKWITFVNRGAWVPTTYSVLCSKHFSEKYIDRTSRSFVRLRDNAVPTIDLMQLQEISKLGGRNAYDFIKRAFQLILSNDQALKYSWKGMKGNRKFNDTRLATLLLRAADVTGLADSQKTSECAIQTWLRRASDRKATVLNKTF